MKKVLLKVFAVVVWGARLHQCALVQQQKIPSSEMPIVLR